MLTAAQAANRRAVAGQMWDRADDFDPSSAVVPDQIFDPSSIWNQPKVYRPTGVTGCPARSACAWWLCADDRQQFW